MAAQRKPVVKDWASQEEEQDMYCSDIISGCWLLSMDMNPSDQHSCKRK
jgi:hypothetical protein